MGKGATMETKVTNRQFCALLFLLLPMLILMSGCSTAIDDAAQLHEAAKKYVAAVHDARREIRRECWEILMDEVDELRAAGKHAEARARLAANYPDLVTVDVLTSLETKPVDVLSEPFGCN